MKERIQPIVEVLRSVVREYYVQSMLEVNDDLTKECSRIEWHLDGMEELDLNTERGILDFYKRTVYIAPSERVNTGSIGSTGNIAAAEGGGRKKNILTADL